MGGLGTPQSRPHLSSCVCTSLDTSSGGVRDSESPIVFLLVQPGFACQRVSPPLHLGATCAKGSQGGAGAHGIPRCVPSCHGQIEVCPEPGGSAPWAAALGEEPLPPWTLPGQRVIPGTRQHCWHTALPACLLSKLTFNHLPRKCPALGVCPVSSSEAGCCCCCCARGMPKYQHSWAGKAAVLQLGPAVLP